MADPILTLKGLSKHWGDRVIFENLDFGISIGDKLAFLGANGSGKSTLLKILAGVEDDYEGEVTLRRSTVVHYLGQDSDVLEGQTLVQYAFQEHRENHILQGYHTALLNQSDDINDWDRQIEEHHLRSVYAEFLALCGNLGVSPDMINDGTLSGGQKKRMQLVKALQGSPELLILDEPTNHLDEDVIRWLEKWLQNYAGTLILVTHDRYFLERVIDRIFELWRGTLHMYEGNYSLYLELKAAQVENMMVQEERRQSFLRKEIEWVRRGPKARTTKSKSRVDRYDQINDKEAFKRDTNSQIDLGASERLGRRVVNLNNVTKKFGDKTIVENFDLRLIAGDRVGLLGPNGCGKSTLLKMMLGELEPDSGEVEIGESVKFAVFRQQREQLDLEATVWETIRGESEYVTMGDEKLHKKGFLESMSFHNSIHHNKVKTLSGGEKNRLQLAQIVLTPANVLVLDEPTNDLDLNTLQVLEEQIENYAGCVLIVSHDRYFLEKICDTLLVFTEQGELVHLPGTYSYYLEWRKEREAAEKARMARIEPEKQITQTVAKKSNKLSYKEQREFDTMEESVLNAEAELEKIEAELTEASAQGKFSKLQELSSAFDSKKIAVEKLYARWEELEIKMSEFES
jgi:ATP-binding cassette subfamily F protein uup